MDMPDGTTWVDPNRPAAVVAGQTKPPLMCFLCGSEVFDETCPDCGEDTSGVPFCWCCGAEPVVAVVESVEDGGEHVRIGVCQRCLSDHGDEYIVVEEV